MLDEYCIKRQHCLRITYYEERMEIYAMEDGKLFCEEDDIEPMPEPKLDIDCRECHARLGEEDLQRDS